MPQQTMQSPPARMAFPHLSKRLWCMQQAAGVVMSPGPPTAPATSGLRATGTPFPYCRNKRWGWGFDLHPCRRTARPERESHLTGLSTSAQELLQLVCISSPEIEQQLKGKAPIPQHRPPDPQIASLAGTSQHPKAKVPCLCTSA